MDDCEDNELSEPKAVCNDACIPNIVSGDSTVTAAGRKIKRELSPSGITEVNAKRLCLPQDEVLNANPQAISVRIGEKTDIIKSNSDSPESGCTTSKFPLESLLLSTNGCENPSSPKIIITEVKSELSDTTAPSTAIDTEMCGTSSSGNTATNNKCSSSNNIINAGISEEEINDIINSLGDDIDRMLDERAEKAKLTAKNVKSILRHVITNKYVLAMVRNTMRAEGDEECELEEAVFEPKLTRSKAKELREKKETLPWPVSTPVKKKSQLISNKLLTEEFSDEEGSSDEEYKPNDEEFHSAEEDASSKVTDLSTNSDTGSEFPALVIAEPDVPGSSTKEDKDQVDRIALRTRSKLPLTDTPLEKIEASFVAPDITVDMYDTVIDDEDWQKFLSDFKKPLDEKAIGEQNDDDGDDPEYNVMEGEEEEEEEEEDHEEGEENDESGVPDENSDVVTREEMNALMSEIFVCATQELSDIVEEEEQEQLNRVKSSNNNFIVDQNFTIVQLIPTLHQEAPNSWINPQEKLQLEEQMRMHVQLLCQSFLLSHGIEEFSELNASSIAFLEELKMFASRELPYGKVSTFYSYNLDEALIVANSFKMQQLSPQTGGVSPVGGNKQVIPKAVKETMAHSKVFMYPHLLPQVGYQTDVSKKTSKASFTRAEDNLIVLGLEQFSFLQKRTATIQALLLSAKTERQIKFRIKNSKAPHAPEDNPIKRYHKYKEMPVISRYVRPFDPLCVLPPCEQPLDVLPQWMSPFMKKAPLVALAPQPPIPKPREVKSIRIINSVQFKPPEKRKYPPILPRGYVSPLKKISPILKKYGHHRRVVPLAPLCPIAPLKPIGFVKKPGQRPIKPKLKSSREVITAQIPASQAIQKVSTAKTYPIVAPVIVQPVTSTVTLVQPCTATTVSLPRMQTKNASPEIEIKTSPISSKDTTSNLNDLSKSDPSETKNKSDKPDLVDLEAPEDVEDDAVDDEQDLAALMAASSTICRKNSMIKKKNKHQRDLESSLALLSPTLMESDPKKEDREKLFAQSYLLRAVEALRNDPDNCEKFLKLLCSYEYSNKSALQLFAEVKEILKDYPALVDDFAGFLLPEQARDCGKYLQYTTLSKIRAFLRKLEVHFMNQPHHIQRILRTFSQLQQQADITSASVIAALQPLLRNQSHLLEEFMQLLPDGAPPECIMTDFEDVQIPNSDGETSCDSAEEIVIPETEDPYGGKDCPCNCHTATTEIRMQNRNRHCAKCGTKFLDGRIYIQTGKVLKPAQVIYHHTHKAIESSLGIEAKVDNSKCSQANNVLCKSPPYTSNVQSKTAISKSHSDSAPEICDLTNQAVETPVKNTDLPRSKSKTSIHEDLQRFLKAPKTVVHAVTENLGPEACISPLPCDVIEDAVLLPDSRNTTESIPSDFSCLSKVISSKEQNCEAKNTAYSTFTQNCKLPDACESKSDVSGSTASFVQRDPLSNSIGTPATEQTWTREQDKLILETCQVHGVNAEAFSVAACAMPIKTVLQVENRFYELMDLVKKQLKCVNR